MSNMKTYNDVYQNIIKEASQKENNLQIQLKFSSNLAAQFTHCVNQFTSVCAKMVQSREVSKDISDKFDQLYSKIKNLVEAAKNS